MKSYSDDLPNQDKDQLSRIENELAVMAGQARKHLYTTTIIAIIVVLTFVFVLLKL